MIFVTGPLYAGKKSYIRKALGLTAEELAACAIWDVQDLAGTDAPEALVERLARHRVVIATELGGGVVPVDAQERMHREEAGRLACMLAARADTVIRVCCGLPQLLKGKWI